MMKVQKQKKSIVITSKKVLAERITTSLKVKKIQIDRNRTENVISELLEEIKKALIKGENIRFPGYLSLHTVISKPRIAMNLKTRKKMNVPAKKVPKVKFSNTLKLEIATKKK